MGHSPGVVDSDTMELSIGGLRIAARATGSGDPVLLLNGMSRPMESWAHFASALQDRTVIAFDAPGVGASQTPVVPHSMPMLADIAARVLDSFDIAKADVVGYSHGGAVAQQLAVGHALTIPRRPCHDHRYEPGRPSDNTLTARPSGSGKFNRLRPTRLQPPLPGSPSARFPH